MELNIKKGKSIPKKILSVLIMIIFFISFTLQPAQAVKYKTYTLKNGGTWTYTSADTSVTKNWTPNDWRTKIPVEKVTFVSPKNTEKMFNNLITDVGVDLAHSVVKYGVETAVSYGITVAKDKLKKKFGAKVTSKAIPILSAFSWSYTVVDILSDMATGQELQILQKASKQKTGIIYVKAQASTGGYYLWNGSTSYGKYPYAKLGPNQWQKGKVKNIK